MTSPTGTSGTTVPQVIAHTLSQTEWNGFWRLTKCTRTKFEGCLPVTRLLLSEIFPPKIGGSGRWFWEIYRHLPRADYALAVGENPHQEEFDRTHDLRIFRLPLTLRDWGLCNFRGLWGYARCFHRLRMLTKAAGVTMVHCGRRLPEGLMALTLKWTKGIPYLCFVHGEDVSMATDSREYTLLMRWVHRGASLLIANSHNTKRILLEEWGLEPTRVCVLHPGVDTDYFEPASRNLAVRQRLGWGERPVLLTVGRLQKRVLPARVQNLIRRCRAERGIGWRSGA
jgi:phosphatidyl-myo-inositol dimannoside synthase